MALLLGINRQVPEGTNRLISLLFFSPTKIGLYTSLLVWTVLWLASA